MLKLFSLIILLMISTEISFSQTEYKPVTKFDPARDAAADLKEAVKEAQKSNKRILLDVGGEWCIWCHYLDEFIEKNNDIKTFLLNNFVIVKINYSKENKNEEFFSKYPEVPGYPHFFVLDKNGKLIHSQGTAELEEGKGYSKDKMMTFLRKWSPEAN